MDVRNSDSWIYRCSMLACISTEYAKYKNEVSEIKNFYLLGRLAEYQYYNIDVMVEKAMELAEKLGE